MAVDPDMARVRWQCRRGMRELDELLCRFLDVHYPAADAAEKSAFQALLALPDPDIAGYLLQGQTPAPELARVIERILDRTEA